MQDRYSGDVGDFGKFGLLRALDDSGAGLRFGLIWYLYPPEDRTADGKFVTYLCRSPENDQLYRDCDPKLYDALKSLVDDRDRRVCLIPQLNILPASTVYFDEPLDFSQLASAKRPEAREAWLARALEATEGCDILLLDPDNGLQCKTVTRRRQKAGKYVFFDEIAAMFDRRKTVILYQHLDRSAPAEQQLPRRANELAEHLGLPRPPTVLRHRSGTSRVYYFIAQPKHEDVIRRTIASLATGPWLGKFTLGY